MLQRLLQQLPQLIKCCGAPLMVGNSCNITATTDTEMTTSLACCREGQGHHQLQGHLKVVAGQLKGRLTHRNVDTCPMYRGIDYSRV